MAILLVHVWSMEKEYGYSFRLQENMAILLKLIRSWKIWLFFPITWNLCWRILVFVPHKQWAFPSSIKKNSEAKGKFCLRICRFWWTRLWQTRPSSMHGRQKISKQERSSTVTWNLICKFLSKDACWLLLRCRRAALRPKCGTTRSPHMVHT